MRMNEQKKVTNSERKRKRNVRECVGRAKRTAKYSIVYEATEPFYHLHRVKYWHNFSSIILNAAKRDTRQWQRRPSAVIHNARSMCDPNASTPARILFAFFFYFVHFHCKQFQHEFFRAFAGAFFFVFVSQQSGCKSARFHLWKLRLGKLCAVSIQTNSFEHLNFCIL